MKKNIKVALLSYGMSGQVFHAPIINSNSNFEITKIWERTKNLSKKRYPQAEIVRTYNDILNDPEVELVVVNTPDSTHLEFTKQALNAGKHVVVEKPFMFTVKDCETVIELAEKKGLILSVFHNRRWDSDFLTVKSVVENQLLGRLVEFESHYDRFRDYLSKTQWKEAPQQGASNLYNLGSHMIDQALVLFGMPKTITANLRSMRTNSRIDDNYHITFDYDKLRVILKSSYLVREEGPRYIIHGTKGSFLKWGIDSQEDILKHGGTPLSPNWGIEDKTTWGKLNTEINGIHFEGLIETQKGSWQIYYENIYNAIRNKQKLLVPAYEAMNVIKIIEAAKLSHKEQRSVSLTGDGYQ